MKKILAAILDEFFLLSFWILTFARIKLQGTITGSSTITASTMRNPERNEAEQLHVYRPIRLEPLTIKHVDDFMTWAGDSRITPYLMWKPYSSREQAFSFFTNVVNSHPWFKGIFLGDHAIGSITLDPDADYEKAELGYVLAMSYWGEGYGTEAIRLALQKGFDDLGVKKIEAHVDPANIASQRILEKNGFKRECLLKDYVVQHGVVKDRYLYSISQDSFK